MKTKEKTIKIAEIMPAAWNPREEISPESVADLAANIKENGLLQNVGVWETKDGVYVMLYGHRRLVACESIGMTDIRAVVFDDIDDAKAKAITRAENEIRLGIDPLKDSELLGAMRDDGMSEEEIAAAFGIPLAKVCRRLKLTTLSSAFRELISSGYVFTTDALERASAYPEDIQVKVASDVKEDYIEGYTIAWSNIRCGFECATRDLDQKSFPECANCLKRTGAQPDLFGDISGKLGRCIDGACHKAKLQAEKDAKVDAAIAAGVTDRVELKNCYSWDDYGAKKKVPDDKNPVAYYYVSPYSGSVEVRYGPDAETLKKRQAANKKRRDTEKKKRQELIKRNKSLMDKYLKFIDDPSGIEDVLIRLFKAAKNADELLRRVVKAAAVYDLLYKIKDDGVLESFTEMAKKETAIDAFVRMVAKPSIDAYKSWLSGPARIRMSVMFLGDAVPWHEIFGDDETVKYILEDDDFLITY